MTFLPIVERELRVASRKRSTFWLRVIAALVAVTIGCGFLLISLTIGSPGMGPFNLGKGLFVTLTWMSLAVALCAGLFFTSDCLSEEKREGTLGFLFLTDLRGYDVVLGKLLVTSLRGCFALLAVFPILAVTLLMGSVAGAEFWKTMLALVNALVVSLAAGMFVSSLSRDAQRAMSVTLCLLLLLVVGGPLLDVAIAGDNPRGFGPFFSLISPGYAFVVASRWGATNFWTALLVSQIVAWILLAATCVLTPRTWQEKSRTSNRTRNWNFWWRYGGQKRRASLRRKLMDRNPMFWLACRERWQSVAVWTFSILVLGGMAALLLSDLRSEAWMAWGYFGSGLTLLLYLVIASQASRYFIEARRSGLVELLLATPLPARKLAQGQWQALLRMFGLPVVIFLSVGLAVAAFSQQAWGSLMSNVGGAPPHLALIVGSAIITSVVTAANLAALSWFGMWMGLTSKNANLATLKTLVFVQVIPWLVISFASTVVIWLLAIRLMIPAITKNQTPNPANFMMWYPFVTTGVAAVLSLSKDVFFIVWARRKLFSDFRELLARSVAPVRPVVPPLPPPPVINAPPVQA